MAIEAELRMRLDAALALLGQTGPRQVIWDSGCGVEA